MNRLWWQLMCADGLKLAKSPLRLLTNYFTPFFTGFLKSEPLKKRLRYRNRARTERCHALPVARIGLSANVES